MERLADQGNGTNTVANTEANMNAKMSMNSAGTEAGTSNVDTETINTNFSTTTGTNAGPTMSEPTNESATSTPGMGTSTKQMLYRHPQDRLIGGVCGGLADLTGMDANLVRILWVVATLITGGGGIIAYLALWMLLPVGTVATGQVRPPAFAINGLNMTRTAVVLIALGGLWFLANIGVLPWLWGGFWRVMSIAFWPALLIGVGYLLLKYSGRGDFKLNLNWNWNSTKERVQNGVGERMPTKQSLKESYNGFRQNFPLKRSRTDRIFMGVCGGIGQRIGIDPNLVRLVWAAFSVGSIGMGVLLYVLLGLFLPQDQVTAVQPYTDDVQDVQVIDARSTHL